MNRRSFFRFLAAAPVGVVATINAPPVQVIGQRKLISDTALKAISITESSTVQKVAYIMKQGRDISDIMLPREMWTIERGKRNPNVVVVGAFVKYIRGLGWCRSYKRFGLSELPNDFVGLDDLKHLGVNRI